MILGFAAFSTSLRAQDNKDLVDYYHEIFHPSFKLKDSSAAPHKYSFTIFPGYGYSLTTQSEFKLSGILSFNRPKAFLSTITISPSVTTRKQLVLPIRGSIWTKGNKYNFVSDFRIMKYPQSSFGLGPYSSLNTEYPISYRYLRIYETAYRKIKGNSLLGVGFHADYRWDTDVTLPKNMSEVDLYKLGIPDNSNSTGFSLNYLYDNRTNPIYPKSGLYINTNLRQNMKVLGSDYKAGILVIDTRKYIKTSQQNQNVLALWNYTWITMKGDSPFLDLPSTGWDMYNNSGRGYIQGRLRGRNFLYQEAEYRFGISKNGFLGGVIFGNIQTVTDKHIFKIEKLYPAAGMGVRIKLKKATNTNLAIDYGFGKEGSHGFSLNIGEVF